MNEHTAILASTPHKSEIIGIDGPLWLIILSPELSTN